MIVSWDWLKEYVTLDMEPAELEDRLTLSGLNHEGTERVGDDLAIDLEVTSNRPDCLGHIGVAREVAVLYDRALTVASPSPKESSTPVSGLTKVTVDCPELCCRYTARVVRGAKIGSSPKWLVKRLEAVGIAVINNVVDISNFVMLECGQPLHAFDFAGLIGKEIIVRRAKKGEEFLAIDHRVYHLDEGMCVIADHERPVALGGVMGGAGTEISDGTGEVLVEAAEFDPLSVRTTARRLNLHSPSSYRFERRIDPAGVDWASRRCCEMILDLAGGELAEGVIDVGSGIPEREPIVLRISQLKRILGIEIPPETVRRILSALGCSEHAADAATVKTTPPSWRRDLTREIDLVEEVARIHGYDQIPEDVGVAMVPSHRSDEDRVVEKVRRVLTAAGFDEAMTASVVSEEWSAAVSPWTDAEPIACNTPMLRGADRLRLSLIPSLLGARRTNESLANTVIELFEIAKVYLPRKGRLPVEDKMVTLTSGGDYYRVKGVLESLVAALHPAAVLQAVDTTHDLLDPVKSCELRLGENACGYLGEVTPEGLKLFGLRTPTTVAELRLGSLLDVAELIPQHRELSAYPAITHDLNLIVEDRVRWADVAATVRSSSGELLEGIEYCETYRDPKKDGPDKRRLLFSITLRSDERTLTREEAEAAREKIVSACEKQHGAVLLG